MNLRHQREQKAHPRFARLLDDFWNVQLHASVLHILTEDEPELKRMGFKVQDGPGLTVLQAGRVLSTHDGRRAIGFGKRDDRGRVDVLLAESYMSLFANDDDAHGGAPGRGCGGKRAERTEGTHILAFPIKKARPPRGGRLFYIDNL